MNRFITLLALLLSTACLETKTDDTSTEPSNEPVDIGPEATGSGSENTGTTIDPEPISASIIWDNDGALLTIENASPDSLLYFGIAQTRGTYSSTAEAEIYSQWTAEDCSGQSSQGDYCHEVPEAVDGFASIELISSSFGSQTSVGDLQYTLFTNDLAYYGFTYILDDPANEKCYVWGDNPAYYDDFYYICEYMFEWE